MVLCWQVHGASTEQTGDQNPKVMEDESESPQDAQSPRVLPTLSASIYAQSPRVLPTLPACLHLLYDATDLSVLPTLPIASAVFVSFDVGRVEIEVTPELEKAVRKIQEVVRYVLHCYCSNVQSTPLQHWCSSTTTAAITTNDLNQSDRS